MIQTLHDFRYQNPKKLRSNGIHWVMHINSMLTLRLKKSPKALHDTVSGPSNLKYESVEP